MHRTRLPATLLAAALIAMGLLVAASRPVAAAATVLYVDQSNASCSDSGAGTQTAPFCTIGQGAAVATAGQTVQVASGTYNELVTVAHSGTSGAPIVLTAAPGASVIVSGKADAFKIASKSYVTVRNFTVTGTSSYGVLVANSSNIVISGNHVSAAGQRVSGSTKYGIKFVGSTNALVSGNVSHDNSDAGIFLDATTNGVEVTGNTTYGNARGYTRAAPGIDVRGHHNTVDRNVSHNNEDSGLQFYSGSHDNLVVDNLSYRNGDHGIDDLHSTGQRILSNTVFGNVTAGVNLEGSSTGATVENNISVDNGVNSPRTKSNIRVDATSTSGTTVNWNLVDLSVSGQVMYVWGAKSYATLSAFQSASGQESHGRQANPSWVAAGSNFHLKAGSPAIDSANSGVSGETSTDLEGKARRDDSATANTGTGPRTYDDRGAYEF
ncbi:MAG TPA: right-handed parallel beta-helix repeat-containing protein [Actinomycetota bacterium]